LMREADPTHGDRIGPHRCQIFRRNGG
jgi:hypothetical protein